MASSEGWDAPEADSRGSNHAGGLLMHALPAAVGEVATLLAIRRDKRIGAALRSFTGIVDPVPGPAST